MKSLLAILGIALFVSTATHAETQTKECGNNVAQVQQIINEHEEWDLKDNHAYRFIGNWGESGEIKVEARGSFLYQTYRFKACPQKDGKMVIINIDMPEYVGTLEIVSRNMVKVSGFTGMARMANGPYARQGSSMTANARGGRQF